MIDDGRVRCEWGAITTDPEYRAYHDEDWGVPVRDERLLFELLVLEGAQAGLSWSTILHKRTGYRRAFDGFDPAVVARYGELEVARLMGDSGIVRNRLKVASAIDNAKAVLAMREGGGPAFSSICGRSWAARRWSAGGRAWVRSRPRRTSPGRCPRTSSSAASGSSARPCATP